MLLRVLLFAAASTPRWLLAGGCIALSHLVFGLLGVRRREVREALARSLPRRSARARAGVARAFRAHLGRSLAELFRGVAQSDLGLRQEVVLEGWEALEAAVERGEGAIVVTAHFGSWEFAAVAAARFGLPLSVVSRHLRVGWLEAIWSALRARIGLGVLPPRGAMPEILSHLRGGGVLGLVIDQHQPPPGGVQVPFLGRPAWTTRAPYLLHRRSGAPLFTVYLRREGPWRHTMLVQPFPVGPEETQEAVLIRLNQSLEARIEANPEQWLWLHRRWKQVPESDRRLPSG